MNRRQARDGAELREALTQDYPAKMFNGGQDTIGTLPYEFVPYEDLKEISYLDPIILDSPNTKVYLPQFLLAEDNGKLLNPMRGFHARWMANDLGDRYEDVCFLFGRGNVSYRVGGECNFFIIDDPRYAHLITDVLIVEKRECSDDVVEDRSYWTVDETTFNPNDNNKIRNYFRYTQAFPSGNSNIQCTLGISPLERWMNPVIGMGEILYPKCGKTYLLSDASRRVSIMREYCRRLLQWREETGKTDDEGSFIMAPAKTPSEMTLVELCEQLNARLEKLHGEYGLENLGTYSAKPDILTNDGRLSLVRSSTTTYQSRAEALRHVTHLEYTMRAYDQYRQSFDELRERVGRIEGVLYTDDIHFAEFEMPQTEPFGPKESPARVVRFSYSARGLAAAKAWLEKEDIEFARCQAKSSIAESGEGAPSAAEGGEG